MADILFGNVSPAGRTTQTWVKDIVDLPHMMDYDIRHGRTYMYMDKEVLYPFGYGLSYTRFDYDGAWVDEVEDGKLWVTVTVTNVGNCDGDEVVQLYASYPESEVEHPRRQLRAFQRVSIRKGEACNISLEVDKRDLSYWDEEAHAFVQVKGPVRFEIGASSADIRQTVTYGL